MRLSRRHTPSPVFHFSFGQGDSRGGKPHFLILFRWGGGKPRLFWGTKSGASRGGEIPPPPPPAGNENTDPTLHEQPTAVREVRYLHQAGSRLF